MNIMDRLREIESSVSSAAGHLHASKGLIGHNVEKDAEVGTDAGTIEALLLRISGIAGYVAESAREIGVSLGTIPDESTGSSVGTVQNKVIEQPRMQNGKFGKKR